MTGLCDKGDRCTMEHLQVPTRSRSRTRRGERQDDDRTRRGKRQDDDRTDRAGRGRSRRRAETQQDRPQRPSRGSRQDSSSAGPRADSWDNSKKSAAAQRHTSAFTRHCHHYIIGSCSKGDNCRNVHTDLDQAIRPTCAQWALYDDCPKSADKCLLAHVPGHLLYCSEGNNCRRKGRDCRQYHSDDTFEHKQYQEMVKLCVSPPSLKPLQVNGQRTPNICQEQSR